MSVEPASATFFTNFQADLYHLINLTEGIIKVLKEREYLRRAPDDTLLRHQVHHQEDLIKGHRWLEAMHDAVNQHADKLRDHGIDPESLNTALDNTQAKNAHADELRPYLQQFKEALEEELKCSVDRVIDEILEPFETSPSSPEPSECVSRLLKGLRLASALLCANYGSLSYGKLDWRFHPKAEPRAARFDKEMKEMAGQVLRAQDLSDLCKGECPDGLVPWILDLCRHMQDGEPFRGCKDYRDVKGAIARVCDLLRVAAQDGNGQADKWIDQQRKKLEAFLKSQEDKRPGRGVLKVPARVMLAAIQSHPHPTKIKGSASGIRTMRARVGTNLPGLDKWFVISGRELFFCPRPSKLRTSSVSF